MKVTVDIPDEQWARLRERARESGCEQPEYLVGEAVEEYLTQQAAAIQAEPPDAANGMPPFLDAEEAKAWPAMLAVVRELQKDPGHVEAAIDAFEAGKRDPATPLATAIAALLPRWRNTIREFAAYTRDKPPHGNPDDERETQRLAGILNLPGSINDEEAEAMRASVRESRSHWR
jgi:hypothetical protein